MQIPCRTRFVNRVLHGFCMGFAWIMVSFGLACVEALSSTPPPWVWGKNSALAHSVDDARDTPTVWHVECLRQFLTELPSAGSSTEVLRTSRW
ncbi:hypothetical protein Y032_0003g1436 [Ancylostoma ceylanicum]|uniref:Uncharacterized protein n=1 Tax=Ancylostoma ceylanicum TaxID=53326 RepID=A0A016VX42_9BILA|nr:hypothetical protein Y032_0003g1436 [Ancylostoma ceylanicum]